MPRTCSVFKCTQRATRGAPSLFSIPKNPVQRARWTAALNRTSLPKTVLVCAKHFVTGKPSKNENDTDFAPSLHLGYRRTPRHLRSPASRTPSPFRELSRCRYRKEILGTPPSPHSHSTPVDRQIGQRVRTCLWGLEPVDQGQMMPSDPSPREGEGNRSTTHDEEGTSEVNGSIGLEIQGQVGEYSILFSPTHSPTPVEVEATQNESITDPVKASSHILGSVQEDDLENSMMWRTIGGRIKFKPHVVPRNPAAINPYSSQITKTQKADTLSDGDCSSTSAQIQVKEEPADDAIESASNERSWSPAFVKVEPVDVAEETACCGTTSRLATNAHSSHKSEKITSEDGPSQVVTVKMEPEDDVTELVLEDPLAPSSPSSGAESIVTSTPKILYRCYVCDYQSFDKSDLITHMKRHNEVKSFPCDICGNKYKRKYNLEMHMRGHTGEKPFSCNLCGNAFGRKHHLELHMNIHTREKPFSCNMCEYRCNQRSNLETHMRTHTGEKPFPCNICGNSFSRKYHLETHMRTHKGEKPFSCNVCGNSYGRKYHLKTHLKTHTGKMSFSCKVCHKWFSKKTQFEMHMRTHTGERTFPCNTCDKSFTRKFNLETHMLTHTVEKPFPCNICDNRYCRKHDLEMHMRTHTGEKPFSCELCGNRFGRKFNLVAHIKTHTGERPFSCNVCDMRFSKNSEVERHMRTHTGEKPFTCNVCGSSFGRKYRLETHMRIHTGEKPYSCSMCAYRCNQKNYLDVHMRTHTGEKPFSCNICVYRSTQKHHLEGHMRKTHLQ